MTVTRTQSIPKPTGMSHEYQHLARPELDTVLRNDLPAFIHKSFQTLAPAQTYHDNWHIQAMAWHLQQTMSGNVKRLLITLPPRNLKSISAVAFTAWLLGRDPSKRIICASYSADLRASMPRTAAR